MSKGWAWVAGILVGLCIVAMLLALRSDRQAYWAHHGVLVRHAEQVQTEKLDRAVIWRVNR